MTGHVRHGNLPKVFLSVLDIGFKDSRKKNNPNNQSDVTLASISDEIRVSFEILYPF